MWWESPLTHGPADAAALLTGVDPETLVHGTCGPTRRGPPIHEPQPNRKMAPISIPTTARLPSSLRVDPSNPAVFKILNRLSRASLLTLALDWLDERNLALAAPYLRQPSSSEYDDDDNDDEDEYADDFHPPARSLEALQELYTSLQSRKGSKREVIDRIIEGDWRHGLTLYQLAMADIQYLYDHPTSQKWAAYRIMPLKPLSTNEEEENQQPEVDKESLVIPRFHPSTFLKNLQAQVPPDVKAHYNFDRHRTLPLSILRIFILDSPYNTSLGLQSGSSKTSRKAATTTFDTSRTVYIAFPDASPYIYISKPQLLSGFAPAAGPSSAATKTTGINTTAGEAKSLQHLLLVGIPAALSRPRQRFCLKPTSLATRNLNELLDRRGGANTRQGAAGGGWSIYADEMRDKGKGKRGNRETPLDTVLPSPPLSEEEEGEGDKEEQNGAAGRKKKRLEPPLLSPGAKREEREQKRRKLVAKARFAETARVGDGKGVERVDIILEDEFPSSSIHSSSSTSSSSSSSSSRDRERDRDRDRDRDREKERGREKERDRERDKERDKDTPGDRRSGSSSSNGTAAEATGKEKDEWHPNVKLTFHGSHVFAGIRQLVEAGIVDGERMPGWLTGEEGVTVGKVREGRIRGNKGSGL
ncbi:centromere protein Chl4/mis15/CENP-N [Neurospora hispaniola]|uniref:Centromere protein Chl4/mis15/CENP-N n=1 Tax=Neurospora hispaniola TaxID=588809 RepID=A0AAJ0I4N0_9PEZI|nr:centromere protein Chl4/mis15/CENP-N [Neurospora hispaniola]